MLLINCKDEKNCMKKTFEFVIFCLYGLTGIVAILGNIFVYYIIHKTLKFRTTTFALLMNMAISDMISGFVIFGQWIFCSHYALNSYSIFRFFCWLNKLIQILTYYISTYSMTLIAIDRFILIKYPQTKFLSKVTCIFLTWIVGFLFTLTTWFNMRVSEYFGSNSLISCRIIFDYNTPLAFFLRKIRLMVLVLSQYVVPLTIIIILYVSIWRAIQGRKLIGNSQNQTREKCFSKSKKKLTKMMIVVVIGFAIAWLPVHLFHLNMYFFKILPKKCDPSPLYNLAYWLSITSCCYNPFIYYWGNADFKRETYLLYLKLTGKKIKSNDSRLEKVETSELERT